MAATNTRGANNDCSLSSWGKCAPSVNEFWRVRLSNGKVPGAWNSLKALTVYVIPFTAGRDAGDS